MVAECDHLQKLKYSRTIPYALTEHGAIMAASVINSPIAIEMSVLVVWAFVRLRQTIAQHKELVRKIPQLEGGLAQHDSQIKLLVQALKQLLNPKPPPKKRRIGF